MIKKLALPLVLSCILVGCGKSPENARKDLAALKIDYSPAAFAESIRKGDQVAVKLFLDSGIDVNGANGAALNAAVEQGSESLARELLKRGAKPTSADPQRYGPIDNAAKAGNLALVKLFVEHGAVIDPNATVKGGGFENALDLAEKNGKTDLADFLIQRFPISKDEANASLLMAVMADEPRLVKRFVKIGADVNHKAKDGDTAIGLAEQFKLTKALEALRELGATGAASPSVAPKTESSSPAAPTPIASATKTALAATSDPETVKRFEGALQLYKAKRNEDALKEFLAAGEKGHGQAQYNAALMYAKGEGTAKDLVNAFKLFTKAKENGVDSADGMRRKVLSAAKDDLDAAFGQIQVLQTSEGLKAAEKAKDTYEELLKLDRGI